MNISIKLINSGNEFIANCPELDINCYGSDKEEAVRRIKKVIAFYIDSAKELGLDINPISNLNIDDLKGSCVMHSQKPDREAVN